MVAKFKVGETHVDVVGCTTFVEKSSNDLALLLRGLEYDGNLRSSNSKQLDIEFEKPLAQRLREAGWSVEVEPVLEVKRLPEAMEDAKADFIIWRKDTLRVLVEVEKANKKTIWFDFMKIWLFMATQQAGCGLLICPVIYAHGGGVWKLFAEACRYKRLLLKIAGVSAERMSQIGIVGYEQQINIDGVWRPWTKDIFRAIKGIK